MHRWFLSYHSTDHAMAERLKAAIEGKDSAARVFFAPTHMHGGGSWTVQLAQEIAGANVFVLLIGKEVGPWQVLEYDEALDKWARAPSEFSLVVVLLEGYIAPGLPFLRRLHWIITPDPASEKDLGRILDAAAGRGSILRELWRHTSPYRGLEAMQEKDSDFFFGRTRETVEVLTALAGAPSRLPVLIGNSGVGKSSLAQAGVLAALKRQAWPEDTQASDAWPAAFRDSRQWCFLSFKPGTDPLKAMVESFLNTWQFVATDFERTKQQIGWIEMLRDGNAKLSDLIDATERRQKELDRPRPPGFFLYVDQGEELYVRAEESQRRHFCELLVEALPDPRLRAMMSMRSDFLGHLQRDEALFKARVHIDVPPLRETELTEVVTRPARLLSACFETDHLASDIARRAAEESTKDAGALPLLSYLLDDIWTNMIERGDGVLRIPAQSIDLGRVLVERADAFIAKHPVSEGKLRRVFTLKLATVPGDGDATRRRALRSEFTDEEWRLVSELADHPTRLLVTSTPEGGETYAEVAHEAIFRRWSKLREWIASEREFLSWRTRLEAARRAWQATVDNSKGEALLMGIALTQAQSWLVKRREDLPLLDQKFIEQSTLRESKSKARMRLAQAAIYALLVGIIVVLIGVVNQDNIKEQWNWYARARPYRVTNFDSYVLTPDAERALKPLASFRECSKDCPEMIVIPAGEFMMGSPSTLEIQNKIPRHEFPQHKVAIARPFAVSKFDVTFADWDACVAVGGCRREGRAGDAGWGRGNHPVIYVNWEDAQNYIAWLSRMTGKTYRLLTEAEWEYAARAGTTTTYYWGDEVGRGNANCRRCGSKWDGLQTAPVGSFAPNAFGLYDMLGNVWQWVEDCAHYDYSGAPQDGSPWLSKDCVPRVIRGSSWFNPPEELRSANRTGNNSDERGNALGFRVARTLAP